MSTQNELFSELVKLKSENPHLDVAFMADGEETLSGYRRNAHKIKSVGVDYMMESSGWDYTVGEMGILDEIEHSTGTRFVDVTAAIREIPNRIKKAIIVYTGAL